VTRDYTIIVPLMLANLVSYLIAKKLQHVPLYEALAHQEGISMPSPEHLPEPLTVEQASLSAFGDDEPSVPSVYVDDPLEAALQRMGAAGTKQIAVFRRTQAVPFASLRFDDAIEAYRTNGTAKAEEAPAQDWLRTGIVVASAVVLLIAGLTVWQRSRQTEFTQETFARGQDLVAKGQFDDAVSAFRSALARNSDDAKVRRALAIALVDSGHFAEAQSYLDEVLKQQSQDGPLRSAAAKAAQATGDKNQALALYRRSLAANWTSDEEPRRQQTLLEFVTLLVESGQRREAASRILAALNDDSIGPSFGRELANLLKLSGSPEQVETAYSTLTTRFSSDVESWIGLGDTRFDANKDSLALEAYRKAATLRPGDADTSVRVALVEEIRQLDPTLPNTSARVRAQRWDSILQRLLDAGEACAPPNLREKAKVAQKTSSSLAALDQKAKAAEELWDTVSECKADPVLAHIFGRLSRL
jgi:tetratricopeptide (TPR) repeat protein